MYDRLVEHARSGKVVLLAGAGVSAAPPSSLPQWKALNAAIVRALVNRLEGILERPRSLSRLVAALDLSRDSGQFPPEYQAQLVEEMCGERYFRALQALDIDVLNSAHEGIASLAAAGALRAIVTTNFDRLIERALQARGVPHLVAYDEAGFGTIGSAPEGQLPVVKIHGSVSAHLSMIDTLKQRKLGRSAALQSCLDRLHDSVWLYAGFSAADLESDPDYLGLRAGAQRSPGAVFVSWPGNPPSANPPLSTGASLLLDAYGTRHERVAAELSDVFAQVCARLGKPIRPTLLDRAPLGRERVEAGLEAWAGMLSPASAALCLGALLEATGQAEPAVRILDRFVRHEIHGQEREQPDFHALQLHYGRMGAALGRFTAVPDLNGVRSNASVESLQSLLRLIDTEYKFAGTGLQATAWLWEGDGLRAQQAGHSVLRAIYDLDEFDPRIGRPQTPEQAIDACLAVAQVTVVADDEPARRFMVETARQRVQLARSIGDPIRAARTAALYLLLVAESNEDLPRLATEFDADFQEARRVGDNLAFAFRELAIGRWLVGPGGLALGREDRDTAVRIATQALDLLQEASLRFDRQGMDPWQVYLSIQRAKALADLRRMEDAKPTLDAAFDALPRFPIWASHVLEARGQILAMLGERDRAAASFRDAIAAAEEGGLAARRTRLERLIALVENAPTPAPNNS